jgi:flagellar basal-body rod modification protein FlgD
VTTVTAIDPLTAFQSAATPTNSSTAKSADPNDQFGKDTFLKLLVAQLRFQNPLSPADPTEFLSQTAQFTMVEKLQELETLSKNQTANNEVLAAATMIGRSVTFAVGTGETPQPIATTKVTLGGTLPADAAPGTKHDANVDVFNRDGRKTTLRMQFTKLPSGRDWELRVFDGARQLFGPQTLEFDAQNELTSGGFVLPVTALDTIPGTAGTWAAGGISFAPGSAADPARLRLAAGSASAAAREQNGSDGHTLTGVVTGVRFDVNGPMLKVGDREIPMSSVTEVHLPTL